MTVQTIDRKNLIDVLLKNPDLPIIANVYSEVVADDGYAYWYGDIKEESCYVDSLWRGGHHIWSLDDAMGEIVEFFELEFPEKITEDIFKLSDEDFDSWIQEAEKFLLSLPWKKYIVLNVDTPNSL